MTVADDDKFFSKDVQKKNRKIWQHRWIFANIMASHFVGALIIIGAMEGIELVLKLLNIGQAFDGLPFAFPFRWLLNASDLAIFVGFLGRGAYVAVKTEVEE